MLGRTQVTANLSGLPLPQPAMTLSFTLHKKKTVCIFLEKEPLTIEIVSCLFLRKHDSRHSIKWSQSLTCFCLLEMCESLNTKLLLGVMCALTKKNRNAGPLRLNLHIVSKHGRKNLFHSGKQKYITDRSYKFSFFWRLAIRLRCKCRECWAHVVFIPIGEPKRYRQPEPALPLLEEPVKAASLRSHNCLG